MAVLPTFSARAFSAPTFSAPTRSAPWTPCCPRNERDQTIIPNRFRKCHQTTRFAALTTPRRISADSIGRRATNYEPFLLAPHALAHFLVSRRWEAAALRFRAGLGGGYRRGEDSPFAGSGWWRRLLRHCRG